MYNRAESVLPALEPGACVAFWRELSSIGRMDGHIKGSGAGESVPDTLCQDNFFFVSIHIF